MSRASNKEVLQDAFIFTLPLMMVDATCTKLTNTVSATDKMAPINQLLHASELVDATFTDIVTPNADTIYSQAFLDLKKDAVIMEFPKTDRFCTVQVLDAYTNTVTVLDAATFEQKINKFVFCTGDFDEELPAGMKKVVCPTSMIWILVRTICNDKADVKNVSEIQKQMDSYTMSQYKAGTKDVKPAGHYEEKNNFVPVQYIQRMSMEKYFEKANQLMKDNPPAEEDAEMLERIAQIQVGPGLVFDKKSLGDDADVMWMELLKGIVPYCLSNSLKNMVKNGCWSYFGKPIAEFGTDYVYRTLIAFAGLGANPVSVAIYPKGEYDCSGERLNGANKYIMHFDKEQLPPVRERGFWSVTAYDSSNDLLIPNELNRFCINDRSNVIYNADGSLDIYIQTEKPEAGEENWLPVSAGDFHFILRIYFPDDVVNHGWKAPVILKK